MLTSAHTIMQVEKRAALPTWCVLPANGINGSLAYRTSSTREPKFDSQEDLP